LVLEQTTKNKEHEQGARVHTSDPDGPRPSASAALGSRLSLSSDSGPEQPGDNPDPDTGHGLTSARRPRFRFLALARWVWPAAG
jgi:hypothetical protein